MKYADIYLRTTTRHEFIEQAMLAFPEITKSTAMRSYNKAKLWLKKSQKEIILNLFDKKIKTSPDLVAFFQDVFTIKVHELNNHKYVFVNDLIDLIVKHTKKVNGQEFVQELPVQKQIESEPIVEPIAEIKNIDKESAQPDILKMLTIQDMISRGFKPSRRWLMQYGYSPAEISWLIKNKYIEV